MSALTELIVTVFLGQFGVHRFIKKDIGMGLLYLFTFGLLGLGWFVDTVNAVKRYAEEDNLKNTKGTPQIRTMLVTTIIAIIMLAFVSSHFESLSSGITMSLIFLISVSIGYEKSLKQRLINQLRQENKDCLIKEIESNGLVSIKVEELILGLDETCYLVEEVKIEEAKNGNILYNKGKLYITNKRMALSSSSVSFDNSLTDVLHVSIVKNNILNIKFKNMTYSIIAENPDKISIILKESIRLNQLNKGNITCQYCGEVNLKGERICYNCKASLSRKTLK